jgi:hypothetical protein
MAEVSTAELKTLLEAEHARSDRRREADIEWRTRLDGVTKTLADEMVVVRKRQDHSEERQDRFALELLAVSSRLGAQDSQIKHIKEETDKQTPILSALKAHMAGNEAILRFLKWGIPLCGAAVAVIVPGLWWLFSALGARGH